VQTAHCVEQRAVRLNHLTPPGRRIDWCSLELPAADAAPAVTPAATAVQASPAVTPAATPGNVGHDAHVGDDTRRQWSGRRGLRMPWQRCDNETGDRYPENGP